VLVPAVVVIAWAAFVWFTGGTWRRHRVCRRLVRREVRAVGNWLATVTAAALVWRPVATAVVLAVVGGSLVITALVTRRRVAAVPARDGPIRVKATAGAPQRLDRTGKRR
jgi:hypothetical protein